MKRLGALAALLALTGCGLQPLYGSGGRGVVANALAGVAVAPIEGQAGWLVRTAIEDRLPAGGTQRFRLDIRLDDRIEGFGIRGDNAVTRERRTLRARYQLVDAALGTVLLDQTAGSDVGIDVVGSQYATVVAEQTALERLSADLADQIVTRVALYASRTSGPAR